MTRLRFIFLSLSLLSVGLLLRSTMAAADGRPYLSVTYYHYPPDIRVVNGAPEGKYIDDLERIANTAGYIVRWIPSTIDDEADMLDDARRAICTTGRMPNRDRTKRWAFLPYIFDVVAGDILVTLPELEDRIRAQGDITTLVHNATFKGALLESGVYGSQVDVFLLSKPDWILRTGKTDFQLMNMILAGRADYTIVPTNQWREARKVHPQTIRLVAIPDFGTHPSYPIFIACSKAVPADTLSALTDAMDKLGFERGQLPQ